MLASSYTAKNTPAAADKVLVTDSEDSWKVKNVPFSAFKAYGKNVALNGDFFLWRLATSQTTNGYNSADMWYVGAAGTTFTFSQQTFTPGQTDVPGNPMYYARCVTTSSAGAANYCLLQQRIENVMLFSGGQATRSFYMKADASKNIAIEYVQDFGTGGSPSAQVTAIGSQLVALTTSWQKFEIPEDIPSVTGKTLGTTANTSSIWMTFWFDAGSDWNTRAASLGQQSGTFDLAKVKLEAGGFCTDDDEIDRGFMLLQCSRYLQTGRYYNEIGVTGTSYFSEHVRISPQMRVSPTVTYSDLAGNASKITERRATVSTHNITPSTTAPSMVTANGVHVLTYMHRDSGSALSGVSFDYILKAYL